MPDPKYVGSPTGGGNPPGKYSKSGLMDMPTSGHFVEKSAYAGSMDVGRAPKMAPVVGNQVKESMTHGLSSENTLKRSFDVKIAGSWKGTRQKHGVSKGKAVAYSSNMNSY